MTESTQGPSEQSRPTGGVAQAGQAGASDSVTTTTSTGRQVSLDEVAYRTAQQLAQERGTSVEALMRTAITTQK